MIFFGCDINSDQDMWWYIDVIHEEFNITASSEIVINILKDSQLSNLVEWIHPEKWIRFSPYTYIDIDQHNVLFSEDILNDNNQTYIWGYADWKWDAIDMSILEYISSYIGDIDYIWLADEILINNKTFRGNNFNNIDEAYQDSEYIEYYISGFEPQYEWMDWKSLTIVFEEFEWKHYVVWIISWSWTI